MNTRTYRQLPPVGPHWHWGSAAAVYISSRGHLYLRWYPVKEVSKIDGGWEVILVDDEGDSDLLYEVDERGESAICFPWDAVIEEEYAVRRSRTKPAAPSDSAIARAVPSMSESTEADDLELAGEWVKL